MPIRQLYRRLRYGQPIVVVSGLPRSGTSMAMKMLEAGGLSPVQDGIRTADEDNPKGYYEDERVKDLHESDDKEWLGDARGKAIKIISFLLNHLPDTHNYKILFMRRHLDEVLASQTKMLDRRGEENDTTDEQMQEVYKDHLWKVNRLLKRKPSFQTLDLDYKGVLGSREMCRAMMEAGLLEEVRGLHAAGRLGRQAAAALGYRQILDHLEAGNRHKAAEAMLHHLQRAKASRPDFG